jgi:hypothetical protein
MSDRCDCCSAWLDSLEIFRALAKEIMTLYHAIMRGPMCVIVCGYGVQLPTVTQTNTPTCTMISTDEPRSTGFVCIIIKCIPGFGDCFM